MMTLNGRNSSAQVQTGEAHLDSGYAGRALLHNLCVFLDSYHSWLVKPTEVLNPLWSPVFKVL